jgi:2,3-dihydroxybenzoate decarboxylase
MRLIDMEAHFWTDDYVAYLRERTDPPRQVVVDDAKRTLWYDASTKDLRVNHTAFLEENLLDLGERRLGIMDELGIDVQVLSLSGPSVEQFDPEDGHAQAKAANDLLADVISHNPTRYVGLATVAPALPEAAAEEIERCVTKLGFRGVNVMSHVESDAPYLDDERYSPIFEMCERLGVVVNLHPTVPHSSMIRPYLGYGWALPAPGLGFGHETATHAMRLIFSGLFDRFPDLQMMLGHFGEALPFWFYRIDFDFTKPWLDVSHRPNLQQRPSEYLKRNFWFNCSGNFRVAPLLATLFEVGADRLLFATDYAWEIMGDAVEFFHAAPLADVDREKMAFRNAEALLGLGREAAAAV